MSNILPYTATEQVQSGVKTWIATCPAIPTGVTVSFEDLPENDVGICIASTQAAFYSRKYIAGGYEATYRFAVVYRVLPSDDSDALSAINTLNQVAAWCEQAETVPVIATGATVKSIERTSDVGIASVYEDGCRDYQVSLEIKWEVL